MKSKLYIAGLVSISLLTYSCSNDDGYERQEIQKSSINIKELPNFNKEVNPKRVDSSAVKVERTTEDGDPSIPVPPRK
jgi:hypothetical protein